MSEKQDFKGDFAQETFDGDGIPLSRENRVPRWLFHSYWLLIVWGIVSLYLFWGGAADYNDRGAWKALQKAANTTSPPQFSIKQSDQRGL